MSDFQLDSGSEMDESDIELQEAFAAGLIKPGINTIHAPLKEAPTNNIKAMNQKYNQMKLKLPWIERLDCVSALAPLAPELAATLLSKEQKRENQLKNNKKLKQVAPTDDPVLNDFKREMMFHRQAQSAVLYAMPLLKQLGIRTIRPDDYLAEMAKTDSHMQKIRENLMNKQQQQQRSERVKQLRHQRKEGKALQIQTKIQRQADKKQMLDQVKKVRKGMSKDMSFLDNKKTGQSKKVLAKKQMKDKKFGFGGKKRGTKGNTRESAADISEYKRNPKVAGKAGGKRGKGGMRNENKRPGKQRRTQKKNTK